ncbi:hypothetical protein EN833_19005 [Mesorhizobium sp. M4B.F.Ca.ET.190.01.1.1]|nr:MAG: hypothetical protein EOS47_04110 [Mesorhizobium sp.]TGR08240.1 hypothetical protein EN843_18995 [Mesorhizobium sp. M4B.F.Ca.ET.200.01.1.1]TGS17597.1 hypothetical protein EN833_19005 [Mesorhizobium sp. M4B.F.Ca.ET.190.01.1.1]TGT29921.1 hypothetical protein EN815_18980 [Mesorhizobium sp. M4B.F.Ca.ET.172.01.1.1]TIT41309.1 MAG: hypothetical protein E5W76_14185 [Mesorhizobium sp.]
MHSETYGYIAFGDDDLYHRGALLSALRLLHFTPHARITIATDRPQFYAEYPVETLPLSSGQMAEMSFGNRYVFGIKAGGLIELLKRTERLLFMDTDIYPVGDASKGFARISPSRSIMRLCEGVPAGYEIETRGLRLGDYRITGREVMWNSGIVGVHRANLPALASAYELIGSMLGVVSSHTKEQFAVGLALSQGGRKIAPHRLPLRHYNTAGKKAFARGQIARFFRDNGDLPLDQQIERSARLRLWRGPLDLWAQRARWRF